jgi:endonuclease VIII
VASGARVHDLELARTDDENRWVGHLGPDILGPDWDAERAAANLAADDRPLVEALLDQRNLAGVGNMYAAELMFLAGVNPYTPAKEVTKLEAVVRTAFKALRANRDHPEQSTTGRTARGEQHWVYLRTGQPCRRCRTAIVAGEFGEPPRQRNTFWCPHCQPRGNGG